MQAKSKLQFGVFQKSSVGHRHLGLKLEFPTVLKCSCYLLHEYDLVLQCVPEVLLLLLLPRLPLSPGGLGAVGEVVQVVPNK